MAREVESKWKIEAPGPLRERLAAAGAMCEGVRMERNHLYDTPERRLFRADCGLRLRIERGEGEPADALATLTYKGARASEVAGVKSRDEFESSVGNPEAIDRALQALGYGPTVVFDKRRETWRLRAATVTLDELPRLGWFMEIEAGSGDEVVVLARQLAAPVAPAHETYVALAAANGARDPAGVILLLFEQR